MTDDPITTIEVLGAVVARLERDLGEARLYGEQECARAEKAEAELAANRAAANLSYAQGLADGREECTTALAAAREALVWLMGPVFEFRSEHKHYPAMKEAKAAISAARGEQPRDNNTPIIIWPIIDEHMSAEQPGAFYREWAGFADEQPKSDVCPTCEGHGDISMGNGMCPDCSDCGGTGKKEKTHDQA